MTTLLDTNVVIRFLNGELSARYRRLIEDGSNGFLVSHISLWEIAIKPSLESQYGISTGRVGVFVDQMAGWLPIRKEHIEQTCFLPRHHSDPWDRLLIAQCLAEDLTIMTSDRKFQQYKGLKLRLV